mmetsp:Transcript_62413/g.190846  ORF Transcript_62413/g.190846 Transcript_62413/m.190846 type:complete len:220 (+) Transcript_62413:1208-1867(+)
MAQPLQGLTPRRAVLQAPRRPAGRLAVRRAAPRAALSDVRLTRRRPLGCGCMRRSWKSMLLCAARSRRKRRRTWLMSGSSTPASSIAPPPARRGTSGCSRRAPTIRQGCRTARAPGRTWPPCRLRRRSAAWRPASRMLAPRGGGSARRLARCGSEWLAKSAERPPLCLRGPIGACGEMSSTYALGSWSGFLCVSMRPSGPWTQPTRSCNGRRRAPRLCA